MAANLTGLYFAGVEIGPVGGVVLGAANRETLIVDVLSECEPRRAYVPVAVATEWEFFKREADALAAFARVCREAWDYAPTNKKPSIR